MMQSESLLLQLKEGTTSMIPFTSNKNCSHSPSLFVATIFLLLLSLFLLASCETKSPPTTRGKDIKIVATLYPTYEFARNIAGNLARVELLLPPGVDPHSFEPKPQDIVKIHSSDLFIFTTRAMEPWADNLVKAIQSGKPIVVDASEGLRFITSEPEHGHRHEKEETIDPHVWLDLENAQKMAENIYKALVRIDPQNQANYQKNLKNYTSQLAEIDRSYKEQLSNCPKRVFISGGHRTFGYLAQRYNLRYLSAYGISPDSEPSARVLAALTRQVKREGLRHIFFEELISPRVAETIARDTGAELLQLRGAHNISREEFSKAITFVSIMKDNLQNLKKGLQCQERQ